MLVTGSNPVCSLKKDWNVNGVISGMNIYTGIGFILICLLIALWSAHLVIDILDWCGVKMSLKFKKILGWAIALACGIVIGQILMAIRY